MVNDLIRLDDQTNYENTQQKFEWTRTTLVIILSLFIGKSDSNLKANYFRDLFIGDMHYNFRRLSLSFSYSIFKDLFFFFKKFVSEKILNKLFKISL